MNRLQFYSERIDFILEVLDNALQVNDTQIVVNMVREYEFIIEILEIEDGRSY